MLPYEILLGFKFGSETNTTNLKRIMSLNCESEAETEAEEKQKKSHGIPHRAAV
jgi:hypothetical protein